MTKRDVLSVAFSCATLYKENLVDRDLLFVTMDKRRRLFFTEVSFDASNYLHLTGLKVDRRQMHANHFFHLCCDRRLREQDFELAADGTTQMKMRVLPGLMSKNLSARMLGSYAGGDIRLYTERLVGSVSACMGFVRSGGAGRYVPNTLLEGDIRTKVVRADRILVTYRKNRHDRQYSEIVYSAHAIDWDAISFPKEYQYLPMPGHWQN